MHLYTLTNKRDAIGIVKTFNSLQMLALSANIARKDGANTTMSGVCLLSEQGDEN